MNRCRRCGSVIKEGKLWCEGCRRRVEEELVEGVVRPLEYYFKYYLKHRKK